MTKSASFIQDHARFLSPLSRARQPSALRSMQPLFTMPGMLSLAGGLPHPSTFAVRDVSVTMADGTVVQLGETKTREAMQYGQVSGQPDILGFFESVQRQVHGLRSDRQVELLLGNGSQDLMAKALMALLGPGDVLLAESPLYLGTLAILKPMVTAMGVEIVPVPTDGQGLDPKALGAILNDWPQGKRRPKALITVPTGGNPTGATCPEPRRRAVYALAQEHDVLILEDDPYYYLSFAPALPQSYLNMDTDDRVLRIESLSKCVAAGLRLGLATGPPWLIRLLVLDVQATSLQPSGIAQGVLGALIRGAWGNSVDGFLEHTRAVAAFYRTQRDAFLRHLQPLLDAKLVALPTGAPEAGMFCWLQLLVPGLRDTRALIEGKARERKVLLTPGAYFVPGEGNCLYVRAAYSLASAEDMGEALRRFGECLRELAEEAQ